MYCTTHIAILCIILCVIFKYLTIDTNNKIIHYKVIGEKKNTNTKIKYILKLD